MGMLPHCMVVVPSGRYYNVASPSLASFRRIEHISLGTPAWEEATWLQGLRRWHCVGSIKLKMDAFVNSAWLTSQVGRTSESDGFVPSLHTLLYEGSEDYQVDIYIFPTRSNPLQTLVLNVCFQVRYSPPIRAAQPVSPTNMFQLRGTLHPYA
jgi:hypothetical protein